MRYVAIPLLCVVLSVPIVRAQDADDRWTPAFMTENFKRVGSAEISPDGEWVAYTVSEPRMEEEESEYRSQIHLVTADGAENFQLTHGNASASDPQWSPDGRYLAFRSPRDDDNGQQIWLIRPAGGEAWKLTDTEEGVASYAWSPDGTRIAYTMRNPETDEERQRREERRDVEVVDETFRYNHLYVIDVEDGRKESTLRLTAGDFHVGSFDWSPDGAQIAFDHMPTPRVNDWVETSISMVPADSGAVEQIVDMGGMDSTPKFSPDGQRLAFVSDGGAGSWPRAFDLYVMDLEEGEPRQLAETFDRQPSLQGWSPDGERLLYTESHRTSARLFAIGVNGEDYEEITTGEGVFTGISLSDDASRLAAVHQTLDTPPDVVVSALDNFSPNRITEVNAGYEQFPMAHAEVITWTAPDGMEIESPIIYPVDYEEGRAYPLLLHVHGGPAGVYRETYTAASGTYPLQAFAAEGYFVLRPNFRGSSGYGKDFRFANIADWGKGDLEDMLAGIDMLIDEGKVHPDSLAIMGWSYGGFMSSYAITQTDRFQTSMVGAGVTNLISMTGTTDITGFLPNYFESEFWENYELFREHSAIHNVHRIETPTLILHPEQDARVPPSQGWELYHALNRKGVETELVLYPRQPHGLQEPKFIQDAGERQIEWLDRFLRGNDRDVAAED